jgi:hypothetical protein
VVSSTPWPLCSWETALNIRCKWRIILKSSDKRLGGCYPDSRGSRYCQLATFWGLCTEPWASRIGRPLALREECRIIKYPVPRNSNSTARLIIFSVNLFKVNKAFPHKEPIRKEMLLPFLSLPFYEVENSPFKREKKTIGYREIKRKESVTHRAVGERESQLLRCVPDACSSVPRRRTFTECNSGLSRSCRWLTGPLTTKMQYCTRMSFNGLSNGAFWSALFCSLSRFLLR